MWSWWFLGKPWWRCVASLCSGESELSRQRWMFEQQALQEYILLCCQNPTGGLLDKPGKSVPHHLDTHTHSLSPSARFYSSSSLLLVYVVLLCPGPETFTTHATAWAASPSRSTLATKTFTTRWSSAGTRIGWWAMYAILAVQRNEKWHWGNTKGSLSQAASVPTCRKTLCFGRKEPSQVVWSKLNETHFHIQYLLNKNHRLNI